MAPVLGTHTMSDPLTVTIGGGVSAGVAAGSAGITFASFFPDATPAVMICALAGAALYVVTSEPHKIRKQLTLAVVSFIAGVYCAGVAADIITAVINAALSHLSPPVQVTVTPPIGALVAATISVTVLLRLMRKSRTASPPGLGRE
jgi:hypothetical protein